MARLTGTSRPFLLGFDQIDEMAERLARSAGEGFPPYNVERLAAADGAEQLRITLAVAGFAEADLEVVVEDATLTVRGAQSEDDGRVYLHRGIAARRFERSFVLAEGMEVAGAGLADGLLTVDLLRRAPERRVRRIAIDSGD